MALRARQPFRVPVWCAGRFTWRASLDRRVPIRCTLFLASAGPSPTARGKIGHPGSTRAHSGNNPNRTARAERGILLNIFRRPLHDAPRAVPVAAIPGRPAYAGLHQKPGPRPITMRGPRKPMPWEPKPRRRLLHWYTSEARKGFEPRRKGPSLPEGLAGYSARSSGRETRFLWTSGRTAGLLNPYGARALPDWR